MQQGAAPAGHSPAVHKRVSQCAAAASVSFVPPTYARCSLRWFVGILAEVSEVAQVVHAGSCLLVCQLSAEPGDTLVQALHLGCCSCVTEYSEVLGTFPPILTFSFRAFS